MFRPKKYNFSEALQRLRRYCAYQERSHKEVRQKLWDWGFDAEDMDKVSVQLMEEGFLNEERFAKALTGGKFRTKGWGRRKILESLKQKGVTKKLAESSLKEIDEKVYRNKLKELLEKKLKSLGVVSGDTNYGVHYLKKKQKAARYAVQKGYEAELVWEILEQVLAE
jgi:regulatory protein